MTNSTSPTRVKSFADQARDAEAGVGNDGRPQYGKAAQLWKKAGSEADWLRCEGLYNEAMQAANPLQMETPPGRESKRPSHMVPQREQLAKLWGPLDGVG